jgi:hypothetical protein
LNTTDCWQQCDKNFARTKDSFWYVSNKNSKGLRQKKQRKVIFKENLGVPAKQRRKSDFPGPQ